MIRICGGENLTVVEVGSYTGESGAIFLGTGKVSRLYCVDPWKSGYDDQNDYASRSNMNDVERCFDERIGGDDRVFKLKGTLDTVNLPSSADIVYIDACHTYEACKYDIHVAIERVNPRIIAGHDYNVSPYLGVKRAVDEILGFPDMVLCDTSWVKFRTPLF